MPTAVTKTVKAAAGDYTSLRAAILGLAANLVTADQALTIEVYAGVNDTVAITAADWTGFVTDATRTITIIAPVGQRHAGVFDAAKWRMSADGGYEGCSIIVPTALDVALKYLQLETARAHANRPAGLELTVPGVGHTVTAEGCILRCTGSKATPDTSMVRGGIRITTPVAGTAGTIKLRNNIVHDWVHGLICSTVINTAATVVAYNNTLVGLTGLGESYGFDVGATLRVANEVIQATGVNYTLNTFNPGRTERTILTQDATSPTVALRSKTLTFTNAAGGDYSLASSDTVAIDVGTDLSADADWAFATDAISAVRPAGVAWEVGAVEFTSTPTKLGITTQPAGAASGSPLTTALVVAVQDAAGVTIASELGAGTISYDANGAATFTISQAGKLKQGDMLEMVSTGRVAQVYTFNGTTGAQLKRNYAAQGPYSFRIHRLVTVAVASGAVTLEGPTSVVAWYGVATFRRLAVRGTGAFTLTASATGLTSTPATSSVTSGAATGTFDIGPDGVSRAELPRLTPSTTYPASFAATATVTASGVQAQLDTYAALPADALHRKIIVQDGTSTTTQLTLRARSAGATGLIVIEAQTLPSAPGVRAVRGSFGTQAKFLGGNVAAYAITTDTTASYYRFVGLEISNDPAATTASGLRYPILIGDPYVENTLAKVSHHVGFDRCWIRGTATHRVRIGIVANCDHFFCIDSSLTDIHSIGEDGGTFSFWSCTGPQLYENNYCEGAGENMIVGGSDPSVTNMVPADITVRRNYFTRPVAWKGVWLMKNCLDLKDCQRFLFEANVCENTWADGQDGTAIVLKANNQEGTAPWSGSSDVVLRNNFIRNVGSAFGISADPEALVISTRCVRMNRVVVRNNLAVNVDSATYNGTGRALIMLGSGFDWYVKHNTTVSPDAEAGPKFTMAMDEHSGGDVITRIAVDDNLFVKPVDASYGGPGSDTANGQSAWNAMTAPASQSIAKNIFTGTTNAAALPTANIISAATNQGIAGINFTTPGIVSTWDTADPDAVCAAFILLATSPGYLAATDPTLNVGCDIPALRTAIASVWSGVAVVSAPGPLGGVDTYPPMDPVVPARGGALPVLWSISPTSSLLGVYHVGGATFFWGTGSPLGVVAAVVGSVYFRLDGGASTTLYIKESGSSTTGWTAK